MTKYNYEFKLQIVRDYLSGKGGLDFLCQKNGIKSNQLLRNWIDSYESYGADGLKPSQMKKVYSQDLKLRMIQEYFTGRYSYQELAHTFGLNNPSLLARWVLDYKKYGEEALLPKKRGRPQTSNLEEKALHLSHGKTLSSTERQNAQSPVFGYQESEKEMASMRQPDLAKRNAELERELRLAHIEIDYLKGLRSLAMEETKQKAKWSPNSERATLWGKSSASQDWQEPPTSTGAST